MTRSETYDLPITGSDVDSGELGKKNRVVQASNRTYDLTITAPGAHLNEDPEGKLGKNRVLLGQR